MDNEFGGAHDAHDERDFLGGEIADVKLTPVERLPKIVSFNRDGVTLLSQAGTMSCTNIMCQEKEYIYPIF